MPANGGGPARQDDEGSLKGIFGQVLVAKNPLADAQHHARVAVDENRKSLFFTLGDKSIEEFTIGTVAGIVGGVHSPQELE
jgi:hypothetical protein